ncbi:MAG TPA: gliding motility-associated C-terminal domain-containing protein [Aquaticitalea sp.]|nr:gliding motility-associated C-terminal domain-containing protein [Aquaticitalea sp.]
MLCIQSKGFAQDISLYQQFNGRYDYMAIGNTLNPFENEAAITCEILTSSSANLTLTPNQNVVAAYLYWAGSGEGELDILLNGIPISAERVFDQITYSNRINFAAFADVTQLIQNQGNGNYTISDFDLTAVIPNYCGNGTNFGGWAITIIYEDNSLPLNQLNVYDGLQRVPTQISITLDNLNVLDNEGAKIGFLAWEGDASLAVSETLSINGNPISSLPLNPVNNAFNGTNSFTGSTELYNMDIDVYNIQNNISIGDSSATIGLTSGQDFVMINNIITVLNSQLPDATIVLDEYSQECYDDHLEISYTVFNTNSTDILPADTPIAFYTDGQLLGQSSTQTDIPINGSEPGMAILSIPNGLTDSFELTMVVDDGGAQSGIVTETNEDNNSTIETIALLPVPVTNILPDLLKCNEGFYSSVFDLNEAIPETIEASTIIGFYENLEDLEAEVNGLLAPESYSNTSNPQTIYFKVQSEPCYERYKFDISVENCPPFIPEGFSPNDDTINDWFNIQGLYDIFLEHELFIFNRYGTLIFEGDNSKPWDGRANRGLNNLGKLLPQGTYFYILHLDDPNYGPMQGWVYINY